MKVIPETCCVHKIRYLCFYCVRISPTIIQILNDYYIITGYITISFFCFVCIYINNVEIILYSKKYRQVHLQSSMTIY